MPCWAECRSQGTFQNAGFAWGQKKNCDQSRQSVSLDVLPESAVFCLQQRKDLRWLITSSLKVCFKLVVRTHLLRSREGEKKKMFLVEIEIPSRSPYSRQKGLAKEISSASIHSTSMLFARPSLAPRSCPAPLHIPGLSYTRSCPEIVSRLRTSGTLPVRDFRSCLHYSYPRYSCLQHGAAAVPLRSSLPTRNEARAGGKRDGKRPSVTVLLCYGGVPPSIPAYTGDIQCQSEQT